MINNKIKIISFLLLLSLFFNILFSCALADGNVVKPDMSNWDKIYENLEEADFEYIFGLDPNQIEEYERYMYSPYPLFRSGVTFLFKSKTIKPGYYLLTPREKNGKTYILFKENGRVSYTIPIYKEGTVEPNFYDDKLPHEILSFYQKMGKKSMNFIGRWRGKKNQRTPAPKAYIEFSDKGEYWNMILYYGLKKYYMLFKKC